MKGSRAAAGPRVRVAAAPRVERPRPSRTTLQEDLTTAGQRRVNLIWEWTQAIIAIGVVVSTMVVGGYIAILGRPDQQTPTILSVAFGTIVGFYFARTNHAAIGGVGAKPMQPYQGR